MTQLVDGNWGVHAIVPKAIFDLADERPVCPGEKAPGGSTPSAPTPEPGIELEPTMAPGSSGATMLGVSAFVSMVGFFLGPVIISLVISRIIVFLFCVPRVLGKLYSVKCPTLSRLFFVR
jgi:hypothetical protein